MPNPALTYSGYSSQTSANKAFTFINANRLQKKITPKSPTSLFLPPDTPARRNELGFIGIRGRLDVGDGEKKRDCREKSGTRKLSSSLYLAPLLLQAGG
jgi:hypothetical protein